MAAGWTRKLIAVEGPGGVSAQESGEDAGAQLTVTQTGGRVRKGKEVH